MDNITLLHLVLWDGTRWEVCFNGLMLSQKESWHRPRLWNMVHVIKMWKMFVKKIGYVYIYVYICISQSYQTYRTTVIFRLYLKLNPNFFRKWLVAKHALTTRCGSSAALRLGANWNEIWNRTAPFYNAYPLETGAVLLQISFQFAR